MSEAAAIDVIDLTDDDDAEDEDGAAAASVPFGQSSLF